ncbi:MAG: ABC transporter ATP-binding protein [Planctomycetales bacterium]|nr:ABC transporter ATP-binding protein [bacterium]UNM10037.1 MAG: ABC transporter ATP-binding protein [Planctomycetales bacterium]
MKVDAATDALDVRSLCKHFIVNVPKKELTPVSGLARLGRLLVRPKKRKVAVDNISMQLRRGEIFGVVGHNGSGKSTLIRMISTLLEQSSGDIRVFGMDPLRQSYQVQRLLNRVSVDAAFFKKLSPNENLLYAARLYGVDDRSALKRAEEILQKLGLEEGRLTDSMQELSRGMQQKVAIARALLTSPVLLLLDEPTTGLDPRSKRDVQDYILELQRTHDATVLLTSHDMDEVERLCGRIALMADGRFVARGTSEELKQQVLKRRIERGEASEGDALPGMEEVFMELTGHEWLSAEEDVDKS